MIDSDHKLQFAPLLEQILPILTQYKTPVYLVGGAVRDAVLGRMSHDLDFVVEENAIQLAFSVGNKMNWPVYVLDRERDVGRVIVSEANTMLDFARFRGGNLDADLRDRDFTINGMAILAGKRSRNQIIDPNGGLLDLEKRFLRHIHNGIFLEDPIRVLRLVRQSLQLDMNPVPTTIELAVEATKEIHATSKERIRDELFKLIDGPKPVEAITLLQEWGILKELLLDIADLVDVRQSAPHYQTVFEHSLSVLHWLTLLERLVEGEKGGHPFLDQVEARLGRFFLLMRESWQRPIAGGLSGKSILRFGALFHDVGKKKTASVEADGRIRFFMHEKVGAEIVEEVCQRYVLSNQFSQQSALFVAHHMRPLLLLADFPLSRRAIYRFFKATNRLGLDIALFSLADYLATYENEIEENRAQWERMIDLVATLYDTYEKEQKTVILPPKLIGGNELMRQFNLKPGKQIGELLDQLQEAQAMGDVVSKEDAYRFIREIIQMIDDVDVP